MNIYLVVAVVVSFIVLVVAAWAVAKMRKGDRRIQSLKSDLQHKVDMEKCYVEKLHEYSSLIAMTFMWEIARCKEDVIANLDDFCREYMYVVYPKICHLSELAGEHLSLGGCDEGREYARQWRQLREAWRETFVKRGMPDGCQIVIEEVVRIGDLDDPRRKRHVESMDLERYLETLVSRDAFGALHEMLSAERVAVDSTE